MFRDEKSNNILSLLLVTFALPFLLAVFIEDKNRCDLIPATLWIFAGAYGAAMMSRDETGKSRSGGSDVSLLVCALAGTFLTAPVAWVAWNAGSAVSSVWVGLDADRRCLVPFEGDDPLGIRDEL